MIKTKNGRTKIRGREFEIIADISIIIRNVNEAFINFGGMTKEEAREKIDFAVEQAFMSDEEIKADIEAIKAEMSGVSDGE